MNGLLYPPFNISFIRNIPTYEMTYCLYMGDNDDINQGSDDSGTSK